MNETDGPIVAAVRQARDKILAECDYDLGRLCKRVQKVEAELADRIRASKKGRSSPRA